MTAGELGTPGLWLDAKGRLEDTWQAAKGSPGTPMRSISVVSIGKMKNEKTPLKISGCISKSALLSHCIMGYHESRYDNSH